MSTKVSIFIPVYNGGNYLKYSVESVMKQTYTDWELLCVDDSSTDDSYAQLLQYQQADERIRVFQKTNGGNVPKSWNFVFPYIAGDFVMYMSQDDMIESDALDKMVKIARGGVDIVLPKYYDYDYRTGNATWNPNVNKLYGQIGGEQAFALSLKWQIHSFGIVRKSLFDGLQLRDDIYISDEWMSRRNFIKASWVAPCESKVYRGNNPDAITKQTKPYVVEGLIRDQMITQLFSDYKLPKELLIYWLSLLLGDILWMYKYINLNFKNWSIKDTKIAVNIYNSVRDSIDWKTIMLILFGRPFSTIRYVSNICEQKQYHGVKFIKKIVLFRYKAVYTFLKTKAL